MSHTTTAAPSLTRYAWLSIAAAVLTIVLKTSAFLLTGSVGLLSDALESLVNLAGALMALLPVFVAFETGARLTDLRRIEGVLQDLVQRCCAADGEVRCPMIRALQGA